jgi:hypothetical protein
VFGLSGLFGLSRLFGLFSLLGFSGSSNQTNQIDQMNQINQVASVLLSGWVSGSFPLKKAGAGLIELAVPAKPGRGVLRWWLIPGRLRTIGKRARRFEG